MCKSNMLVLWCIMYIGCGSGRGCYHHCSEVLFLDRDEGLSWQICSSIRKKKTPHNIFFSNHMICWICLYRCETRAAQPAQLSWLTPYSTNCLDLEGGSNIAEAWLKVTGPSTWPRNARLTTTVINKLEPLSLRFITSHPSIRPSVHPSIHGISTYCPFCRTSRAEVIGIVLLQPIRQPLDGIQALRLHLASQRHDFRAGTSMVGPWPEADTLYIYIYRPTLSLYILYKFMFIYLFYLFIYLYSYFCVRLYMYRKKTNAPHVPWNERKCY